MIKAVRCFAQIFPTGDYIHPNPLVQPIPTGKKFKSKNANPKFKRERGQKVSIYIIYII